MCPFVILFFPSRKLKSWGIIFPENGEAKETFTVSIPQLVNDVMNSLFPEKKQPQSTYH